MATSVDIRNLTRQKTPVSPYQKITAAILPGWNISLVFVGTTRAKDLNQRLRAKSYVPNVLSYESGPKSGEIIICLKVAKEEASSYGLSYTNFVAFLFIHGLLHLKGLPHGTTMERYERDHLSRIVGVTMRYDEEIDHGTKNRNRHRHRNVPD